MRRGSKVSKEEGEVLRKERREKVVWWRQGSKGREGKGRKGKGREGKGRGRNRRGEMKGGREMSG